MFMMKFIQHNTNRQQEALHTVLHMALEDSVDVVLIQEPYIPKEGYIQHPSYYPVPPLQQRSSLSFFFFFFYSISACSRYGYGTWPALLGQLAN